MSVKRKIGWILLIILILSFNIFIFTDLGVKGFLMFYGLVFLLSSGVLLFVWLFNED